MEELLYPLNEIFRDPYFISYFKHMIELIITWIVNENIEMKSCVNHLLVDPV